MSSANVRGSPAAVGKQSIGAVHREAAGSDEGLLIVFLHLLVEREREQVLDVAAALPHRADIARNDEAACRGRTIVS